jgi:hypothetical protein
MIKSNFIFCQISKILFEFSGAAEMFGRTTQVGLVSFGQFCADPKYPGVYARVTDSLVIPDYSILNYSIARIFFFKDPGYPGDSNPKNSKTVGTSFYDHGLCFQPVNVIKFMWP